jgi:uncharacterized Zn-finger protein
VHMKERAFVCSKCDMRFSQAGNLKRHQNKCILRTCAVDMGKGPYECPECNRRFTQLNNLQRHRKIMHNLLHIDVVKASRPSADDNLAHVHTLGYDAGSMVRAHTPSLQD